MAQTSLNPISVILSQPVTYVTDSQGWKEPTVILAGIAIFISFISLTFVFRQYLLDKQRFKKEMFDKRYQIYANAMTLIGPLRFGFEPDQQALFKVMRDVVDAHLLLPKLVGYLEEIRDRAMECQEFEKIRLSYNGKPEDDNFRKKSKKAEENYSWFAEQVGPLNEIKGKGPIPITEKFKKYLEIQG